MRLNIGVICGGKSVEHEVSIISAIQMIENMDQEKYNPVMIYVSKNNEFYHSDEMLKIETFKNINEVLSLSKKVMFRKSSNTLELLEMKNNKFKKIIDLDVIFLVVHGTNCEDGTLAAYFELLDIPYVGSNILSSAINQNKWKMKQLLEANSIPIVDYIGFYENDYYKNKDEIIEKCEKIGFPLIVKPATLGSSVGITKCNNLEKLHQGIISAFMYDKEVVVEKALENFMELNCSVLGNEEELITSDIERVIQDDDILSYKDKYLRGGKTSTKGMVNTRRELPAQIEEHIAGEIKALSIQAIKIVGGSGVNRIDFLYDLDEKQIYLNEINTIPGSLSFYLWKSHMNYRELINRLIKIAIKNYQLKHGKIFTYESNILSLPRNFHKGKLK